MGTNQAVPQQIHDSSLQINWAAAATTTATAQRVNYNEIEWIQSNINK